MDEKKKYEISLMLRSEENAEAILKLIEKNGAAIEEKNQPSKIKLAYAIKKENFGYFMYAIVSMLPEAVAGLKHELELAVEVLRFLIITPPIGKEERRERNTRYGKPKAASPEKPEAEKPAPEPEVVTNELLEKKLEEILK